jgi:hypothetical protein
MELVDTYRGRGLYEDAVYHEVFAKLKLEYPMVDDTRLDTAIRFYMDKRLV